MNNLTFNTGASVVEDQNLAKFNRDQLKPFIQKIVERIYDEVDKATEKGIALSNLTDEEATRCVAQILFNIQKNMGAEIYSDRNIFQSAAYMTGMILGYPTGAINAIVSKLPLISHFKAGFSSGEVLFQKHAFAVYMKMTAKKNDLTAYLNDKKKIASAAIKETVTSTEPKAQSVEFLQYSTT